MAFNATTGYQNRWVASSGLHPPRPTRMGQFAGWQAPTRQWNTSFSGASSAPLAPTGFAPTNVSQAPTGFLQFAPTNRSQATTSHPAASSESADSPEGGYDYTFVETPPDRLMCQICQAVARAPHQVTCCGRVYCETCLDKYRRRSSNCPNCRKRGQDFPDTRGELMEGHAMYLTIFLYLNVKIPCPNNECKVSVLRCNLSKHRSKCPFEEVPCKYAGIGCEKELPRKDLVQHENDDSFHLHLALETINKLQVKERSCIFKMPGFSQHKSSSQEWYSPPFYTHPGGYKMCIMVNANGDGTHVAVFACLMRGRNDDNLPWPFTGKVTFTLLNQLGDENHHTDAVTFPHASNASKRVVNSDKVSNGYGMPEFISHDKLAAKNYQYLKDDSLFFRIKVQATKPVKPWLTCTV